MGPEYNFALRSPTLCFDWTPIPMLKRAIIFVPVLGLGLVGLFTSFCKGAKSIWSAFRGVKAYLFCNTGKYYFVFIDNFLSSPLSILNLFYVAFSLSSKIGCIPSWYIFFLFLGIYKICVNFYHSNYLLGDLTFG